VWITHRLVGLEDFDEVVVLGDGRVVERGTLAELCAIGGTLATLPADVAVADPALPYGP
jgi:ATP-binding cassette subfamily C protein CydCD